MGQILTDLRAIGKPFWLLWIGETISLAGTQLASFAMGVWIYEQTGSALTLAGSVAAAVLPALLAAPIAGSVVDNLDKRYIMIAADAVSASLTVCVLMLLLADSLQVAHLYVFTAISALCTAFQLPAYQASVAQMVHQTALTRASGAMSTSVSTLAIFCPAIAGVLLAKLGLAGIVFIDLISFLCGTALVWRAFWLARRPRVHSTGLRHAVRVSLKTFFDSISFFIDNASMRLVLFYVLLQASMFTLVTILIVPLVLSNYSTRDLGITLSFEAMGGVIGGMLLVMVAPPKRPMLVILGCDVATSLCIFFAGFTQDLRLYWLFFAIAGFCAAVAGTCVYAIWMSHIPPERRGSILVAIATASMLTTLVIVLFGGALVDFVFDPAMAVGGALASTAGELIGVGKGRGMALMFVVVGVISLLLSVLGLTSKRLRRLA